MADTWNLSKLYLGLDDPEYVKDVETYKELTSQYAKTLDRVDAIPTVEHAERILALQEKMTALISKLFIFVELQQSTDTENGALIAEGNNLMRLASANVANDTKASKILAKLPNLATCCERSEIINDYKFYLTKIKEKEEHMLSDAEEEMYAKMDMTGGGAWGNLQSFLTSTVKVDYKGEQITLTNARNLAYDPDPEVRKAAYEAELASYEKIQDSLAYALNNIKLQSNMIATKRDYNSLLDMTLANSNMKKETLDAMIGAIEDHLPKIRKYFTHKAEILGHKNGLPWYDIFAPLGKSEKKYTIEETKEILTSTFAEFSEEMSGLMAEAFDNEWIDFYPRAGKVGGAFDCGVPAIGESRVLTNFDGSFSAIDTLAHELGHSFHDRQVQTNRAMNMDYPMQVAETASTFNETFLCNKFLEKAANSEEKLALLEGLLTEQTQCIVDIYSRYVFENSVVDTCESKFLMAEDLKALMLEAQEKAYGEGLDPEVRHPYMWACKGHYYSSGLAFYNFPYAFGVLFAAGLYSLYLEEGKEVFVPKYKAMLNATPTCNVEEAGALMDIDLTDKKFWESSLEIIEKNIEEYCKL